MIKKITISMMICVTLFLSIYQPYVKASTAASNSGEVIRGVWQSTVMALAASGAAALQTKKIIDDNRDKILDKAGAAWDKMSTESQRVFGEALDAGRLGASETYNEIYTSLENILTDVYKSTAATSPLPIEHTVLDFNHYYVFSDPVTIRVKRNPLVWPYSNPVFGEFTSDRFTVRFTSTSTYEILTGSRLIVGSGDYAFGYNVYLTYDQITKDYSFVALLNLLSSYRESAFFYTVSGYDVPVLDPIYDQALSRLKDQDIPKMRDAGLVLPEPTITGAQGQKLRYDSNLGTLVLPDGTIYTGDYTWSYPKPGIGVNKNPVWQNDLTGNDTDIWTGAQTDTITGNPAIPDTGVGEGTDSPTITTKLDKILEGVRAIPDAIVTGITTIFVPTATPTAFSNMIKQFTGLLVLPSFAWLTNSDLACSRVQDVKVTIMGKSLTIVSLDFVMQAKTFYMPIMRGFLWFLFGWYAYKKIIAMINKVDGVSQ